MRSFSRLYSAALDRLLVFATLVGVTGVQRIAHPFKHLIFEAKSPEQFGELRFEHFLADMLAAAGCRVALASIGVTGAVIIDVSLLLDLADNGAAAGMAGNQPGKGEVVPTALTLLGEASVEHALHPFPEFHWHQRLVLALNELPVPFEPARIEPVSQDGVNRAHRDLGAALGIGEPCRMGLARCFLQRNTPRCAKSDGPSPPSARRRRAMAGALSAVGGSFPDRLLLGLNDDKQTGVARPPPSSAPSPSVQPADAFLFTKV